MKPGIYYFYEYQMDKKIRTVGFLKLVQTFDSCRLQISIRQISAAPTDKILLSMLFPEKDRLRKKAVTELPFQNSCISCRVSLSKEDFPAAMAPADLQGFLLETSNGDYFAACCDNCPFSLSLLTDTITTKQDTSTEPAPKSETKSETKPENPPVLTEEKAELSSEAISDTDKLAVSIRKLSYHDLSTLPKPLWRLANNSFLLHGCHNYHHLLLLEENGHQWLGIPGIYSAREANAAELFGFPQFTRDYHQKLTLSDEECSEDEDFGYWCRCLK